MIEDFADNNNINDHFWIPAVLPLRQSISIKSIWRLSPLQDLTTDIKINDTNPQFTDLILIDSKFESQNCIVKLRSDDNQSLNWVLPISRSSPTFELPSKSTSIFSPILTLLSLQPNYRCPVLRHRDVCELKKLDLVVLTRYQRRELRETVKGVRSNALVVFDYHKPCSNINKGASTTFVRRWEGGGRLAKSIQLLFYWHHASVKMRTSVEWGGGGGQIFGLFERAYFMDDP